MTTRSTLRGTAIGFVLGLAAAAALPAIAATCGEETSGGIGGSGMFGGKFMVMALNKAEQGKIYCADGSKLRMTLNAMPTGVNYICE